MGRVLQAPVPLSKSILWQLNDAYYQESGVAAWSSGDVPYQSTTSSVLGASLASIVAAFAEDCAAGRYGRFDPDEPLYVVDLGAGSGRLAWHFLEGLRRFDTTPVRVVYVLSDMVAANVSFCDAHPRLRPAFAARRADLALYTAGSDEPIRLLRSGRVLEPGSVTNPIIGIASYLFCVIPQDLYLNVDGRPEQELVGAELAAPADVGEPVPGEPAYLRAIRLRPVGGGPDGPVGDGPDGTALAAAAAARTAIGERLLYPSAAIRSIDRLAAIAGERMLFLLAERAMVRPPSSAIAPAGGLYSPAALLGLGVHGSSLSMPVDIDVLALAMEQAGRQTLRPASPPSRLELALILAGEPVAGAATSLRRQARESLDGTRADDVFATVALAASTIKVHGSEPSLDELVSILRVSGLDSFVFRLLFEGLARELPRAEGPLVERAVRTLIAVAGRDYPLEPDYDLVYGVAALLTGAGRWAEALACLQAAVFDFGMRAEAGYDIAICHLQLDNLRAAIVTLDEVRELDPSHEGARRLRSQLPR